MSEVGLVTTALPFKGQQKILPATNTTALVLIDHIDEEEGQNADVSMCQVGPNNVEHLVKRVQAVGVVCRFLWPRLKAAISPGQGPVDPSPPRATRAVGQNLMVCWSHCPLSGVLLTGLNVRMDLLSRGVLGHVRGSSSMGGLWLL